jgi:predicted RNA-binding protein (virulence factor B family)
MELGKINKLKVSKVEDKGFTLFDGKDKEVFLDKDQVEKTLSIEDEVEVFIYNDADNEFIATTKIPAIQIEEFAFLKVKAVNKFGAFVEWGLDDDLMVPFVEQTGRLEEENWYLFFLLTDEKTGRLILSRRINDFVFFEEIDVKQDDEVDLLVYNQTDLGINCIVNNMYKGLIFKSDIHKNINPGDKIKGFVKQVREDGKIDVVLEPLGYKKSIDKNSQIILDALQENDGFLELTDKSSPEDIKFILGLSKKAFKRSLGNLYKQKMVELFKDGVKLV